ncbi:MAG: ABC transporter permease [Planctomycetales bacterium 12-60-4]|nr:MAG: ABC transporter permease [Planctomycetales bacterium 12-60-4]
MWSFACRNLWSRPVRSLLALLGLTVAIMGMVGLFSVAAGLQATVDKTFNRVPGLAAMQPGTPIPIFSRISAKWADEIEQMPGVRNVCRELWARANLVEGQTTFNPPRFLFGADVATMIRLQQAVFRDDMVAGRFLNADDIGQPVCVISRQVAKDYRKEIGDKLQIDGFELQIIGLYETNSLLLDVTVVTSGSMARQIARIDDTVLSAVYIEPDGSMPQTDLAEAVRARFRGRGSGPTNTPGNALDENPLANLAMTLVTGSTTPPAANDSAHPDQPGLDEGLEVRSIQEWGQRIQQFSADLDISLVLMNSIGVMIALLSILNTMLMSVSERMTEFGVLRANGWSARDVMRLILAESAVLGILGGVFGCTLGYLGTLVLNAQFPTKLNLYASPNVLMLSLVFSTILGMIGGLYPAWWSVRRSPMDAIRRG